MGKERKKEEGRENKGCQGKGRSGEERGGGKKKRAEERKKSKSGRRRIMAKTEKKR